ncbi:hypothetical protein B0T24DRAFT_723952 [Lasiosphaeria ovina]|uniref:Uncharacterized protein n=1 Tax=Lasiosphaeria ovina TaxID=92902 RepID=A0AAE0MZS5_9PEZI|nr:hypothetical protein B0T24DRAFT_723952 [Lasiosphaeria ovina]
MSRNHEEAVRGVRLACEEAVRAARQDWDKEQAVRQAREDAERVWRDEGILHDEAVREARKHWDEERAARLTNQEAKRERAQRLARAAREDEDAGADNERQHLEEAVRAARGLAHNILFVTEEVQRLAPAAREGEDAGADNERQHLEGAVRAARGLAHNILFVTQEVQRLERAEAVADNERQQLEEAVRAVARRLDPNNIFFVTEEVQRLERAEAAAGRVGRDRSLFEPTAAVAAAAAPLWARRHRTSYAEGRRSRVALKAGLSFFSLVHSVFELVS